MNPNLWRFRLLFCLLLWIGVCPMCDGTTTSSLLLILRFIVFLLLNHKPAELEKAQRDLALNYNREIHEQEKNSRRRHKQNKQIDTIIEDIIRNLDEFQEKEVLDCFREANKATDYLTKEVTLHEDMSKFCNKIRDCSTFLIHDASVRATCDDRLFCRAVRVISSCVFRVSSASMIRGGERLRSDPSSSIV